MHDLSVTLANFFATIAFSVLVATSWFFVLLTAFPIFVQFVLVKDVNLRIWDVVLGGFPLLVTSAAFFVCWLQRRYMLSYRLERIPRHSIVLKHDDAPVPVVDLIRTEFLRASAISYYSQPTTGSQPGWGAVGSRYEGVYFRREFLNALERLDRTARKILPSLPHLTPTVPLTAHFRPLLLIIPTNSTALRDMDAVMQIASFVMSPKPFFDSHTIPFNNNALLIDTPQASFEDESWGGELTEKEFERGMDAISELQRIFDREVETLGSDVNSLSDQSRRSQTPPTMSLGGSEQDR
ncbi:hypothetical protein CPB86DRAFT_749424 [Serendipita vermifera]|nr:hypothetical protein CPB86DRAFT_749424 [Serendipita vermifera]